MRPPAEIQTRSVSLRLLLGIYLVLPACALAIAADRLLLGGTLRASLPVSPNRFALFAIFFGTPHIVASNLLLVSHADYRAVFGRRVLVVTALIVAASAIGWALLPFWALYAAVATVTIVHVVRQQIGIAGAAGRISGAAWDGWSVLLVGASVVLYNAIFIPKAFSPAALGAVNACLLPASVLLVVLAAAAHRRAPNALARAWLWSNTAMGVAGFAFYGLGYAFFAVLAPRLIHDATAFAFYVVHDRNRDAAGSPSALSRAWSRVGVGALAAVPLTAFVLTWFLQTRADGILTWITAHLIGRRFPGAIAGGFVGYLGLMHYYTEAITWKADSPYRRFVALDPR